jgi:GH25 family lysozyme M1 (1,4-beta-N-acetylmuramidase)
VLGLALAAPGFGAGYATGIDVSHWNRAVNWARVATAGHRFVFAKATEGASNSDFTYAAYRANANAARLKVGAYHFARPGGRGRPAVLANAVVQADHFVTVAQPRGGDLLPVLDLETTGGLRPPALIAWTSAWLREVERRLRVKPIVYASPRFWNRALSDTTAFAASGYGLWLAHWTRAPAPFVPAFNWASFGWTFWQWTSCGRVVGIRGCVDVDRFKGPRLSPVLVRAAPTDVSLPTIAGSAELGQTLTAAPGSWQGTLPISLAYRWQRCDADGANCTAIPDATAQAYTLMPADVGSTIVVVATATNRIGFASATSLPTPVVVGQTAPIRSPGSNQERSLAQSSGD